MVLMKGFDQGGFVFFTNYDSRKGTEIDVNPFAALVFHWKEILRQVRIEGKVQRVAGAESDEYFASRPLESKISAIASVQSRVIPDRKSLEEKFEEVRRGAGTDPARPAYWGDTGSRRRFLSSGNRGHTGFMTGYDTGLRMGAGL